MFKMILTAFGLGAVTGAGVKIGERCIDYLYDPYNRAKIKRVVKNVKAEFKRKGET